MFISNPYILGVLSAVAIIAIIHLTDKYLFHQPFWRKRIMYPADHAVAHDRILKYVDVVATSQTLSDDEIAAELVRQDVPKIDSDLLVFFVPMAFTWMVLKKMGASSFPNYFLVFDKRDRPIEMPFVCEHYFAAALVIAESIVNHGFSNRITRQTFEAIITRSAEMDSTNKILGAGKTLDGSKIGPPLLLGLLAEEIKSSRLGT